MLSRFLKSRPGTRLSCESSGQAGLSAARQHPPDLIRRLLANGATAYLTKPLDLAGLGGLVGSLAAASTDRRGPAAGAPGQPATNPANG